MLRPRYATLGLFLIAGFACKGARDYPDPLPGQDSGSSSRDGNAVVDPERLPVPEGHADGPFDSSALSAEDAPAKEAGGAVEPCSAGDLRCSATSTTVEVCGVSGNWSVKETCAWVCAGGVCTGECKPSNRRCGLDFTPDACNSQGTWVPGARCQFACTGDGNCTGECRPGSKRCSGAQNLIPQTCDEEGKWVSGAACTNLCSSGSCGGSCMPGTKRCGTNATPETCSAQGTWETGTRCEFVCLGAGECTGECRPGSKRCEELTPQTCDDTGRWRAETACRYLCRQGNCAGSCSPGSKRCTSDDKGVQTCGSDGTWTSGSVICPSCHSCNSGECRPQTGPSCDGGRTGCSGGSKWTMQCEAGACAQKVTMACANGCNGGGSDCQQCGGHDEPCCMGARECNTPNQVCISGVCKTGRGGMCTSNNDCAGPTLGCYKPCPGTGGCFTQEVSPCEGMIATCPREAAGTCESYD